MRKTTWTVVLLLVATAFVYAQEPAMWSRGLTIARGNLILSTGVVHLQGTTAALTLGGGTSTTPLSTSTAGKNFLGFWTKSTATSGDSRGLYLRHYIMGAGGSGEALRAYATVDDVEAAVGGTVNGAHISLLTTPDGTVSGAGHALRATFEIGASGNPGGTLSVLQLDSSIGGSATVPSNMAYLSFDGVGTAPTTNGIPKLFTVTNSDDGLFANASGTSAANCAQTGGLVPAKVLNIVVDGTAYAIPLCTQG